MSIKLGNCVKIPKSLAIDFPSSVRRLAFALGNKEIPFCPPPPPPVHWVLNYVSQPQPQPHQLSPPVGSKVSFLQSLPASISTEFPCLPDTNQIALQVIFMTLAYINRFCGYKTLSILGGITLFLLFCVN